MPSTQPTSPEFSLWGALMGVIRAGIREKRTAAMDPLSFPVLLSIA